MRLREYESSGSGAVLSVDISGLPQVLLIAAGCDHTAAVNSSGRAAVGTPMGAFRIVHPGVQPDESIIMTAAGCHRTAAVTSSGRAPCWGGDGYGKVIVPFGGEAR